MNHLVYAKQLLGFRDPTITKSRGRKNNLRGKKKGKRKLRAKLKTVQNTYGRFEGNEKGGPRVLKRYSRDRNERSGKRLDQYKQPPGTTREMTKWWSVEDH